MPFRFVHSADIHLDSPLKSLALRNADLADLVANATREAFVNLVTLCIDEDVDALLLPGDLYDGDQTSMKTARFFADQMRRLDAAGIKVFILRGNHDALSKITKELVLPDSIFVFEGRAAAIPIDRGGALPDIVVHGISFSNPTAVESLLPKYKAPVAGAINIGMMHTSLGGAPGHDVYAPCSVADLDASGFHYWALGHIHKRSIHKGQLTVVMPGNPQGRDINEAGAKSVSLVTIADDGVVDVEERNVSIAQFERLTVDIKTATDWRDLVSKVANAMRSQRRETDTEHLIVRVRLSGTTPLTWQIRRDFDLLQADLEAQAAQAGNVWLEKVELDIFPLDTNPIGETDVLGELRRLIGDQVLGSPGFLTLIKSEADDLIRTLPQEIRRQFGQDEDELEHLLDMLATEGADDVLARLQGPASTEAR